MFVHLNRDRIINFERALRDLGIRDDLYLLYKNLCEKMKGVVQILTLRHKDFFLYLSTNLMSDKSPHLKYAGTRDG